MRGYYLQLTDCVCLIIIIIIVASCHQEKDHDGEISGPLIVDADINNELQSHSRRIDLLRKIFHLTTKSKQEDVLTLANPCLHSSLSAPLLPAYPAHAVSTRKSCQCDGVPSCRSSAKAMVGAASYHRSLLASMNHRVAGSSDGHVGGPTQEVRV